MHSLQEVDSQPDRLVLLQPVASMQGMLGGIVSQIKTGEQTRTKYKSNTNSNPQVG